MEQTIRVSDIICDDRIRTDLGNIDEMCTSIREFGLIQPIVLVIDHFRNFETDHVIERARLVAGGRRFAAIKRLGWHDLIHAKHFVWRDEKGGTPEIDLKMKAIEIEENVKRKELTWQERVLGERELLLIMQKIHGGAAKSGAPTRAEKYHGEVKGFGVNKLAAMLGKSAGSVSQNIQLANAITKVPQLAQAETAESARRQITTLGTIIQMQKAAPTVHSVNDKGEKVEEKWILYEGELSANISKLMAESVDLVYSDLPFAVELSNMSKHAGGVISYRDTKVGLLQDLTTFANESYRILKSDRYAVFWFGFNYYTELLSALQVAGFKVNVVPFIWFKNSRSTENPNQRYGNSYDPAIIAAKGSPSFIRPGMQNFFSFPQPTGANKLQIAQQPVELVTRFLQDMVVPKATVCDLTAGSGTTGVAAVKFGCKAIMFEREPEACAIIRARMGVLK
jgi:site-specific DNA-methyltransferase (adenine-specific)